ncbi:MAG: hypothetical protein ABIS23_00830 [Sphingomicrobium sp.]
MIASFSNNFIFVKTRKVGGTSLEIVLSSWCSGRDICTPIAGNDEPIRAIYGGKARNNLGPGGGKRFINHMPSDEIRAKLPGLWDRAFKFTVERHPYEKVVSRAFWEIGKPDGFPNSTLEEQVDIAIETGSYLNYPLYCSDGKVVVDEIWKFEEMWERLAELAARLGKSTPSAPPRAKSAYRKDRRPAAELLTKDQRRRIAEAARIEFELLGFEP